MFLTHLVTTEHYARLLAAKTNTTGAWLLRGSLHSKGRQTRKYNILLQRSNREVCIGYRGQTKKGVLHCPGHRERGKCAYEVSQNC